MLGLIFALRAAGAVAKGINEHQKQSAKAKELERKQRCCSKCKTVVTKNSKFCPGCGHDNFTTLGAIEDHEAEQLRLKMESDKRRLAVEREVKMKQQKEREFLVAVRKRCKEILHFRYCQQCHKSFTHEYSYCDSCGNKTSDLPREYALQFARDEFPELDIRDDNLGTI